MLKAILFAVALALMPAPALAGASLQDYVRWAGCDAQIEILDEGVAGYDPINNVIGINRKLLAFRRDEQIAVVLHESGHCLQAKEYEDGFTFLVVYALTDPSKFELGADQFAAEKMCQLGIDAHWAAHDALSLIGGIEDTWTHGTFAERMAATDTACSRFMQQAP